jgi:hypothetical protein
MSFESLGDVNTKNREQRTKASANGGDGKFTAVSANHGCYAYFHNCHSHIDGFGCNECERKVANDVVTWEQGPGVCGFNCKSLRLRLPVCVPGAQLAEDLCWD